jgi:predicted ATPase/DNA-binding SARP family transcriptional activator/tetratricopeptide (TPR) repeat protein
MARLELALLGGFHAAVDGAPISGFDADKTRALLAYLAVERAYPHRREALAGLLWPEFSDDAARRNLRYALFKLRQALGEDAAQPGFLEVTPQTVAVDPAGACESDVAAFAQLLAACRAHRHRRLAACATCHARFQQAVALYRGAFLQGFFLADCQAFEEWLLLKREGLQQAAVEALASLAHYHEARAEPDRALDYTYRLLALEPWREEAHRQAMRLLAQTGQRSAALAQYATCRAVLAADLQAAPDAATTALYERLRAADAPAFLAAVPPANLPPELTPFIGRETELRRLNEWLDSPDYGLLTILGPGGVGKTRLALHAATAQRGAFADGIYWAPLDAGRPGAPGAQALATTIAQAVGLALQGPDEPSNQVGAYLRAKELLLVLDNFEPLLGEAPDAGSALPSAPGPLDLLETIWREAPRVKLLVTSRTRLGLRGESLLDLEGLAFPAPAGASGAVAEPGPGTDLAAYSAVQLFLERARQVDAGFALDAETQQGVGEICRLVAGLPLGIVLAAAWVRYLAPARIAAALKANLDFLTSATQGMPPQHASLRAVFNHSWALLGAEDQALLRRLTVFRGGWDEVAAAQVVGATMVALAALVDKSLLRFEAAGRFDLHTALRQYAAEKLDAAPAEGGETRDRHARYYLALAEQAEAGLRGGDQAPWVAQLEREHDNLRAALHWAREQADAALGLRLAGALWRFWYLRGYLGEGRLRLEAALEIAAPDPGLRAARAKALHGAGALASQQGDYPAARRFYEQSLALRRELGDQQGMAALLNNLGLLLGDEGNYLAARALHEESLALRRALHDRPGLASSLMNLGLVAHLQGDYPAAEGLYQESLALRRAQNDAQGIALVLSSLGIVAQNRGKYALAQTLHEESLSRMRALGNRHGIATGLISLGIVAQNQEEYGAARARHEEGLALSRETGNREYIALALYNLGVVAQAEGQAPTAQRFYTESLDLSRELGAKVGISAALNSLGWMAQARGEYESARALHAESLALRHALGALHGVAACLAGLGCVLSGSAARRGARESAHSAAPPALPEAITLWGATAALLDRLGAVLPIEDRRPYEDQVALVRALVGPAAFAAAWGAGQALPLDTAIHLALAPGPGPPAQV